MSLISTESMNRRDPIPITTSCMMMRDEGNRISTFENAMEGFNGHALARIGFFYDDSSGEIECFSCGARHIFRGEENRIACSYRHQPTCDFVRDLTNVDSSTNESLRRRLRNGQATRNRNRSQNARTVFPCDEPVHRDMRRLEDRMATFGHGWRPFTTRCSQREIAEAGFYYTGPYDEVVCFYCGGGLENWRYDDNPWFEHAKWHPNCNFLLQNKGIEFVENVVSETPDVERPTTRQRSRPISNYRVRGRVPPPGNYRPSSPPPDVQIFPSPAWERQDRDVPGLGRQTTYRAPGIEITTERQARNTTSVSAVTHNRPGSLQEMMRSLMVDDVISMGFSREEIRNFVSRKLRRTGQGYADAEELINDIFQAREEHETQRSGAVSASARVESALPSNAQEQRPEAPREVESGPSWLDEPMTSSSSNVPENVLRRCRVCADRPSEMIFLPCAHLVTCRLCSSWLGHCPVCEAKIDRSIKVRTD